MTSPSAEMKEPEPLGKRTDDFCRWSYQACAALSIWYGGQICVGTDVNGNVTDWRDCEFDIVAGFGAKIPGSWGADISQLRVW